ncbi:VENN motif pre-toxin domain-containing protein [Klebsiella sp. Ap-873]|nr:VENN motif pre-toxin domain-containing protein [Klebsiella sp. Ap-873]
MYPGIKREDLSEEQKQTISALSTLAAGLAGNSTADVVAGAQTGKNAVENNYLSNKQRSERDKEFDACKGNLSCQLAVGTKWHGISVGQDVAYGTGMLAGVPLGLYESVDSLSKAITNPVDTLGAIKQLLTSDDMFSTVSDTVKQSYIDRINLMESEYQRAGAGGAYNAVSDTVKQSYIDRINLMESEYQRAGAGGAYNAGVEAGKLMSDLLTTVTGGVGVTKAGVH